ncbi:PepSY-like domain-containing protein [Pedobacter sp. P351]|uniref:PepSY-like domain-containing protein n=1 Tax=Pedobacter superstes TaxID=3133441 RepID=UPI0030A3E6CA
MKTNTFLKGLSFVAVAGLLALTSCDKQTEGPETNEVEESRAILVAEATSSSDAVFIVNTVPAGCDKDSIATTELHTSIGTYLATNYSGYTLVKAFKIKKNSAVQGYIVVIKFNDKPVGLLFNENGNFIRIFEQRERGQLIGRGWKRGGRFDGRDGQHRDTIALSALPLAIKTYFLVNYTQDTLLAAHAGRNGDVVVISANNGLYATLFTANSLFVKRAQLILNAGRKIAIRQADLSANIATYLSTTYPGYVFHRAYAVKVNSVTQAYVVFIDSNDTKYALQFDSSGNFVKSAVIR